MVPPPLVLDNEIDNPLGAEAAKLFETDATRHKNEINSVFRMAHLHQSAVPDIPLRPVIRGYEGIGFRKLFGAIA